MYWPKSGKVFRFKSIISTIISLHLLAIVVATAFMPIALFLLLRSAAVDLQHRSLRENVGLVSHYLSVREDGSLALDLPDELRTLFSETYGRYSYSIIDATGRILFSSRSDRSAVSSNKLESFPSFFEKKHAGADLVGALVPVDVSNKKVWVEVTQDLAHRDALIDDIVRDFFYRVGWIVLPIFLVLLGIDVAIFRRALKPLHRASEMADQISPARTDVRLPISKMPAEIRPLVKTVNEALDRLERGFRIQREFTADAAHELRTPLAILNARIDTLDDPILAANLRRDIAAMTRIVNQLLDIAELENFTVAENETADLRAVCLEAAEFLARLALMEKKQITLSAPDGPVLIKGNAEALFRAIRNVGENAVKYTRPGTAVGICLTQDGTVSISDDGPGILEEHRELIFQRFWRGDRQRANGAGLGLSIVRRVVDAHMGTVSVVSGENGGAIFSLNFKPLKSLQSLAAKKSAEALLRQANRG